MVNVTVNAPAKPIASVPEMLSASMANAAQPDATSIPAPKVRSASKDNAKTIPAKISPAMKAKSVNPPTVNATKFANVQTNTSAKMALANPIPAQINNATPENAAKMAPASRIFALNPTLIFANTDAYAKTALVPMTPAKASNAPAISHAAMAYVMVHPSHRNPHPNLSLILISSLFPISHT